MKRIIQYQRIYFYTYIFLMMPFTVFLQTQESMIWKAGTARMNITPSQPLWLGGYASRDHPSEGVRQELWIKAIALEDLAGKQGVLVSMDLRRIPKNFSDRIRDHIEQKFYLGREQIILNASHTHTAPEVNPDEYIMAESEREKLRRYSEDLERKVVELVERALADLEPAKLFSGNGITRFQVNRRNNLEQELTSYTELKGPNDYAVPVIKILDKADRVKAILFGYACHPNVMSDYLLSGDFPGYAQKTLEALYPGVTALFFQGAGGDQNPIPRREPQLAEQYGLELAAAVDRILNTEMKPLTAELSVSYSEVTLCMVDAPPSVQQLKSMVAEDSNYPGYLKQRTKVLLRRIHHGQGLPSGYPYPVQVWSIGSQLVFALGGELLVGYAIELKRIFGDDVFVFGYCNDVMGYIPTVKVLGEGGYEATQSPYSTNPWRRNIEYLIINECQKLAKKLGVN